MRGKILSLALIFALFGAFFVGIGRAQTVTIYCDPAMVSDVYTGTFDINVMITGGEGVYAWEFRLDYPPYVQQITVIDVVAGDYLGPDQMLAKNIDYFNGEVLVGSTMVGDVEGAYGDGTLATVRFGVIEPAGEFPMDLISARIFLRIGTEIVEMDPADIGMTGSYFLGPVGDLYASPGETRTDNVWRVGKSRRFKTLVSNNNPVPLWFRARYTSVQDTGRVVTIYNGQHMYTTVPRATEYYYVNEFTGTRLSWIETGTSPYLDTADATSYVTGQTYCTTSGMFGFQDITLNPGDIIYRVTLEGRTRAAHGDIDYDVYDASFNWYGSLYGGATWTWRTPRWIGTDTVDTYFPGIKTQAGFNGFQVLLHYYTPDGSPLGPADIDAMRLKVEFIGLDPTTTQPVKIQPNTIRTLDWAIWDLWPFDVGTYTTTTTLQYRYGTPDPRFPQYWATASVMPSNTWTVHP